MSDPIAKLKEKYPGAVTYRFGDNALLCDELLDLVREGRKRATCAAMWLFEVEPTAMPRVGRCDIATDWDGNPALVTKTTALHRIRFCDVTEEMALAEGEDESLEGWRRGHEAYFRRIGEFDPEMMVLFEYFDVVEVVE